MLKKLLSHSRALHPGSDSLTLCSATPRKNRPLYQCLSSAVSSSACIIFTMSRPHLRVLSLHPLSYHTATSLDRASTQSSCKHRHLHCLDNPCHASSEQGYQKPSQNGRSMLRLFQDAAIAELRVLDHEKQWWTDDERQDLVKGHVQQKPQVPEGAAQGVLVVLDGVTNLHAVPDKMPTVSAGHGVMTACSLM